jgi:signal peptidase I
MDRLTDLLFWPFSRLNRLFSGNGKMRRNAENWLDLAEKVRCYRSDRFTPAEADELAARQGDLRRGLRDNADAGKLKLAIEALEEVLRRVGGSVYPKTSLAENVDFFLVAAIVILGIRTYFVQPFKIPTNSMWPTYYGMTAEKYSADRARPRLGRAALPFRGLRRRAPGGDRPALGPGLHAIRPGREEPTAPDSGLHGQDRPQVARHPDAGA